MNCSSLRFWDSVEILEMYLLFYLVDICRTYNPCQVFKKTEISKICSCSSGCSQPNLPSEKSSDITCFLRNLYTGQEATVRTRHGTTDWFKIRKGVRQSCILSPCFFNLYAEYIMWHPGLDESQAGIKFARRNINNLRYADDTTLMAESQEELMSLLNVKEESEKAGLKHNIPKTKIPFPSLHGK